jgi:glutamyl-tRNA synthetase
MVAFLFTSDADLVIADDALSTVKDGAAEVIDAALSALEASSEWTTESLERVLREALVEGLELSPRHAFTPVRVAVSGRRVSPPLFESMEILGRESTLARLRSLRQTL